MPNALRTPGFRIALLAVVLALGFLGSRGIWDPDEGRYTNVALNMLDSGDWLNPRRNDDIGHWTKPPLTYWAIAVSVAVFGDNAWAARLPAAMSYLICVWLAWRIARRLSPGSEHEAALIYATMLFTVGASQLITTDYVLAACSAVALWGFVEARFDDEAAVDSDASGSSYWIALMWTGFALAFLTKGPPGLLLLLVVVTFDRLLPGRRKHRLFNFAGMALFALLALPWYIAVIRETPGLLQHFIGDEVVNRVATDEFGRNGEWYGWAAVYGPTLLLGTLPWTPALLRWARGLPASIRAWRRDRQARDADRSALLLALSVLVPLLVFSVSRSRMPLYILPLFVPLAILAAVQRRSEGRALPHPRWLLAWAALLLALKFAAAYLPTHKNAEAWAHAIRQRADAPVREIVFVEDMARYGLHVHMGKRTRIDKITLDAQKQPRFNPEYDGTLKQALDRHVADAVWICKQGRWLEVQARVAAQGYRAVALGAPYQRRILFRVVPAP